MILKLYLRTSNPKVAGSSPAGRGEKKGSARTSKGDLPLFCAISSAKNSLFYRPVHVTLFLSALILLTLDKSSFEAYVLGFDINQM